MWEYTVCQKAKLLNECIAKEVHEHMGKKYKGLNTRVHEAVYMAGCVYKNAWRY